MRKMNGASQATHARLLPWMQVSGKRNASRQIQQHQFRKQFAEGKGSGRSAPATNHEQLLAHPKGSARPHHSP
jgi:hypothetical protein